MKRCGRILNRTPLTPNEFKIVGDSASFETYNQKQITSGTIWIDADDVERVSLHKWYLGGRGYAISRINGKLKYLHHYIMGGVFKHGTREGDHKDRNTLNNRKLNLRVANRSQQSMNARISKNNKSGYKGVSWCTAKSRWAVYIGKNSKGKFLGYYDDPRDAAVVYNNAASKYYGEFAVLNAI